MDRKGILRRFVIENSSIFLSSTYTKEAVKEVKRKYFIERFKNKFGVPSNNEIAEALVEGFISIQKITNVEELNSFVSEYPFLRDNIHDLTKFECAFSEIKPPVTRDDIKKLKVQTLYELEKEKIKEEVIVESTKEIQEAIEKKTEEYLSLPSVLDAEDIEKPLITEVSVVQPQQEWWERLNLKANPFPRQEGLSQIPLEMYEEVVVRTQIYNIYINRARNNVDDLLFKGKLLIGDFGYGKTTLFDYLSFVLLEHKIKVIRISLPPRGDVFTLNVLFENKLFNEVKNFYKDRFKYDYAGNPSIDTIIEMLNILTNTENWCFIVVIDDLHKIIGGEGVVIKFLGSLQITKDELIRKGVKIGFLVAGLPEWQNYLRTDGALRGFFDTIPDFMPEVTPELAYDVIKKRFVAFAKNPEINNFIDLNIIKQIHRKTTNEGRYLGFRTFMSNVEIELRKGNFTIFESNPIKIEQSKLKALREIIESEPILKRSLNKFIYGSRIETEENRDIGLKILIKVYLDKGITEDDEFFLSHKYYFQKLARSNLINKVQIQQEKIKWVINPLLLKVNKEILSKYNLSMEDYLRPIYISPFKRMTETPSVSERDLYDSFIDENKSGLEGSIELLKSSLAIYHKVVSLDILKIKDEEVAPLLDEWKTSLAQISSCIFSIENILPIRYPSPNGILKIWDYYWTYPDTLKRFNNELASFVSRKDQIPLLRRYYVEAFNELFNLFREDFEISKKIHITLENLRDDEINLFHKCRYLHILPYKKSNYFDLLKSMNEYVEKKIRVFLRNFMYLLFGDRRNILEQIRDPSIRQYIERDPRTYESISFNEFENLNRGQYKKIFMECHNLKKAIFEPVLGNAYTSELNAFLEAFCDYNILTSHLKTDSIQPQEQSRIYDYLIHSANFIKRINIAYSKMLCDYFYVKNDTPPEIISYFSLRGIKGEQPSKKLFRLEDKILADISDVKSIITNKSEIERVWTALENIAEAGEYYLDLEDYILIEKLFTVEYRKFISILAYYLWTEKISVDNKFGTRMIIRLKPKPEKNIVEEGVLS